LFEYIRLSFDYLTEVSAHLDLMAVFFSIIKYAALGFALGLGAVIVCVKFKFFKRQNKYWNIATKLYYLFIPIVCIVAGGAFGFLQHCKDINDKVVNTILQPIKQEIVGHLQNLPPEIRETDLRATMQSWVKPAAIESNHGGIINRQTNLFREWLLTSLVTEIAVDRLNKEIATTTGLDKGRVNQLWRQNVVEIFKGDFFKDLLSQRTYAFIHSYQKMLLLIVLLLFSIPTVDTLIAKRLERRKHCNAMEGNREQAVEQ
jgi:hypothetical protein